MEMQPLICSRCGGNQFGQVGSMIQCLFCNTVFCVDKIELQTLNQPRVRFPEDIKDTNELIDFLVKQDKNSILVTTQENLWRIFKLKDGSGLPLAGRHGGELNILGMPLIVE